MKTLTLLLLLATPLYAADSTKVDQKDIAYGLSYDANGNAVDADGDPVAPYNLNAMIDREGYLFGWRFESLEWMMLKDGFGQRPEYDNDPIHGTNGGYSIG